MVKFFQTLTLLTKFVKFAASIVNCVKSKDTESAKTDYDKVVLALSSVADVVSDPDNVNTAKEVGTELFSIVEKLKKKS